MKCHNFAMTDKALNNEKIAITEVLRIAAYLFLQ